VCSLIVAAPWIDPCSALDSLLPLLIPSGAFVVYSPTLQPLTLAMDKLMKARAAVGLKLVEPWFREHQVRQKKGWVKWLRGSGWGCEVQPAVSLGEG
jgi:hypothetical protein